jgi:hypothetical protein
MPIVAKVDKLVAARKLLERSSSYLGISARRMIVTPEIDALAKPPFEDTTVGERHAALAQYLDAFCELNEITVSEVPDAKPRDIMLARVSPVEDDFWSMRVTDPEDTPGMRILGAFCDLDCFVGLTYDFRENIYDFDEEVLSVKESWKEYFGDLKPLKGKTLDDYLTNYVRL